MVFVGLALIGMGNWIKVLVGRPRPDYQIFDPMESSLSFPSGHSLLAVILGGLLIYLTESMVKPVLLSIPTLPPMWRAMLCLVA